MKLSRNFLVHNTEEESVLVPTGSAAFSGVVRGNRTLGAILDLLKKDTTAEQLVAAMKERYDAPEDLIRRDVNEALSALRKIGALDD